MSSDLIKRANKLEQKGKLKKLKKFLPFIILTMILLLVFLPGRSKVVYATVETSPALRTGRQKYTVFKAKLNNKEVVEVKSKEHLELTYGDKIKLNKTTSILFNINRYSFYSKIYR